MKTKNVYFLKSCAKVSQFPDFNFPEFAFIGRSNVGKSSLINLLVGNKNLVKTGAKPGVTKTINFFILNERISIVDLPGYGYAKLPAGLRGTFLPLITRYIEIRQNLKLVFLLMDIRRIPDKYEHDMIKLLIQNEVPVALTLTKCDKLSKNKRQKQLSSIIKALGIPRDAVFETSSNNSEGKKELLALIDDYS